MMAFWTPNVVGCIQKKSLLNQQLGSKLDPNLDHRLTGACARHQAQPQQQQHEKHWFFNPVPRAAVGGAYALGAMTASLH